MCIICLRTGKKIAHHVVGLSRFSSSAWLGNGRNAGAAQCRAFSSLPEPVEEGSGKQHSKEGCECACLCHKALLISVQGCPRRVSWAGC